MLSRIRLLVALALLLGLVACGGSGGPSAGGTAGKGTLKWRYQTGNYVRSSPAIGADGTIYMGSLDAYLYAINPNGTRKWKYKMGDSVSSSPAIGADGTIYVGSNNKYLYAINSSSKGLANSPWPKFHQNSLNTGRAP